MYLPYGKDETIYETNKMYVILKFLYEEWNLVWVFDTVGCRALSMFFKLADILIL